MGAKLKKAERRAAGLTCIALFHVLQSGVAHPLKQLAQGFPNAGGSRAGLTDREAEYIEDLAERLFRAAELIRALGWRLR